MRQRVERGRSRRLRGLVGECPHITLIGSLRWPDEAAGAEVEVDSHLALRACKAQPSVIRGAAYAGAAIACKDVPSSTPGMLQSASPVDQC